jgi:carboxyl-terminal processing protease
MNNKNKNLIVLGISISLLVVCLVVIFVGFSGYQIYQSFFLKNDSQPSYLSNANDSYPDTNPDQSTNDVESTSTPGAVSSTENSNEDLSKVFEAFWNARELLHDNYLVQPIDDQILADGALNGIITFLEENNLSLDEVVTPEKTPTAEEIGKKANTPSEVFDLFLPFWDVWNKLKFLELPEGATETALMRHALTGMVAVLDDPYTNYFDPDLADRWNTDLSGEYEGIGAWVDVDTEYLTIISPIKGTPAEEAGLQPGDQIIAIDGDDMTGVDPNIALKRVLGDAGTKVVLTIMREGKDEPFDVEIIRRKITIPYIESEILDNDIAYLRLIRFYDGGDVDIRKTLEALLAENPKGLIFDLRGNPGGYLHTVVNIASEFLTDANVLIEEFSDGSQKYYPTKSSQGIATEIPLVVLIDQGSASASEIFAGAIKDYSRGLLVGQTSFGKGLVQLPITLPDDQGLISITIAKWLTPNGTTIHKIGIQPDYIVEFTEADSEQGTDPQLNKAIELLLENQE